MFCDLTTCILNQLVAAKALASSAVCGECGDLSSHGADPSIVFPIKVSQLPTIGHIESNSFRFFLSRVSAFLKREECDGERCATYMRDDSEEYCAIDSIGTMPLAILASIPCPSLRALCNCPSYCAFYNCPSCPTLFRVILCKELDALGAQGGMRRLGRLVHLGRLVVRVDCGRK